MKLKRVVYELYDADMQSLSKDDDWHELDREISLNFEGDKKIYISWCDTPVQFCVSYQDSRFNRNEPDHHIDVSSWRIWQNLIGFDLKLLYLEESRQVLHLKGEKCSVYLSSQSQGSWLSDVLHISSKRPKLKT